jgi:glycosyltransferase involved in cell wall biosynthesis
VSNRAEPAPSSKCAFVIPGDLSLATGGYAYDRRVLAGLVDHGVTATHVPLQGAWPNPSAADFDATAAALAALPADTTLLIDGLAYGAFPEALLARIEQRVVALCHHPLGLETGVEPARAAELVRLETAALAKAERVIVTSPLTGRLLAADFAVVPMKITVACPGTDPAPRSRGSGGKGPVRLLAVGSIIPRKGYLVLVEALHRLMTSPLSDPPVDWQLTVVGSARDANEYRKLVAAIKGAGLADRIELLSGVTDAQLDALYAVADLFVMPSLFEGYGMVLAEALARGLAIVCTRGGAADETVPDAASFKVLPGDPHPLKIALGSAIMHPELREMLANASWAAGQNLPRWHDTCRIIASVIKGPTP